MCGTRCCMTQESSATESGLLGDAGLGGITLTGPLVYGPMIVVSVKGDAIPGFKPAFVIMGGLDKPFYVRFRELRKTYTLEDKGLIECMLRYTFRSLPETVKP